MEAATKARSTQPGVGAALLAFAVFLTITLLAQEAGRRQATAPWGDVPASGEERIEAHAVLSNVQAASNSRELSRATAIAILGESRLDLSEADLASQGGRLAVIAILGQVRVRVPEGWTVVPDKSVVVGSFEDRTHSDAADPDRRLRLEGLVLGGSVEVTH